MITYKKVNGEKIYRIPLKNKDGSITIQEVPYKYLVLASIAVICLSLGFGHFYIQFLAANKHFIILSIIAGLLSWNSFQPDKETNKLRWLGITKSVLTLIPLTAFAINQIVNYNEVLQHFMLTKFYFIYMFFMASSSIIELIISSIKTQEEKE